MTVKAIRQQIIVLDREIETVRIELSQLLKRKYDLCKQLMNMSDGV